MQAAAVKECSQTLTQEWSEWHWQDNRIIRHQRQDWNLQEECDDCAYLENHLRVLRQLKQELLNRAAASQGSRKEDFEAGVREKERQIEYVVQRLKKLNGTSKSTSEPPEEGAMTESVAVEVIEELSADEERDRLHLERKVERAFYEAGSALRELRDRRLYRSTYKTFEEYCRERFTYSRQAANYLIAGAKVFDNLTTNGCQNGEDKEELELAKILPTNERQVRPLTKLEPEQQRKVWQQAVEEAGDKVPSNRVVKSIVQRIKEKTPVPNPYQVGEVCQIVPKDNPELKGMSRCWAIVREVNDFSCTVQAWDGEYQVRIENLKLQELSAEQREEVTKLCDRLERISRKIQFEALSPSERGFLKGLGEQVYLSELQENILLLIENHL